MMCKARTSPESSAATAMSMGSRPSLSISSCDVAIRIKTGARPIIAAVILTTARDAPAVCPWRRDPARVRRPVTCLAISTRAKNSAVARAHEAASGASAAKPIMAAAAADDTNRYAPLMSWKRLSLSSRVRPCKTATPMWIGGDALFLDVSERSSSWFFSHIGAF
eukprot:scaffold180764_cov31-Tisochrysis_lutea.AAC.4